MALEHQPARRFRVVGALLLLDAVVVPLLLALFFVDGADSEPETYVGGDGTVQTVPVPDGRTMVVWADESVVPGECRVESEDGAPVELERVGDGLRKPGGKTGDWVGTSTFETHDDAVRVSCRGAQGALVTPAPSLFAGRSAVVLLGVVALAFGVAGLGFLAFASRQPRPPAG